MLRLFSTEKPNTELCLFQIIGGMSAEESRRVEEKLMQFHTESKDGKYQTKNIRAA